MTAKPTIFFDIDGTLIQSNGSGTSAIDQTLQDMFGIVNDFKVPLGGRTDYAILTDIFHFHQIDFEKHYREFSERYHEQLKSTLLKRGGDVLPGVMKLLQQLESDGFPLGIVTGNAKTAAWHKLRRFELDSYFQFGGYGDDSPNRNDVASQAVAEASDTVDHPLQAEQSWIIGDTPADVTCAKSVGAKSLVVLTGSYDHSAFEGCDADRIVTDLTGVGPELFW